MGNMREISIEECTQVSGGIIIVDGYPPTPGPGGGGNNNSGTDGAVMYLNMNSTVYDYSLLYGQIQQTVSENPDAEYDGEEIVVTAFTTEHMNSLRDQAQQMSNIVMITAGVATGGLALEAGILAYLTSVLGAAMARSVLAGAAGTAGVITEEALTNFFLNILVENDKEDVLDDGKINRSTWMTPDSRGQLSDLINQWNDLNTPNPDPEPGDSDWE